MTSQEPVTAEASERVRMWLDEARRLLLLPDLENYHYDFALDAARAGEPELAIEVGLGAPSPMIDAVAHAIGAGRYENEGIAWIEVPDARLPLEPQYAGALVRACVAARLEHIRRLVPMTADPARSDALRRIGDRPVPPADLVPAGELVRDATVAPERLIEQLAEAGHATLALAIVDVARIPASRWGHNLAGPLGSVAAGLAARGDFDAAVAIADRCPGADRGEAINVAAGAWIRQYGPESAPRFRALLRRGDSRAKAFIEAYVAGWRAMRGDAGVIGDLAALKGLPRFCAQGEAFEAYLRSGHLDLAEATIAFTDGSQSGFQLGLLAGAWASAGDLGRAEAIAQRARGEERSLAWENICHALADAGRHDEAEDFAATHITAAWLKGLLPSYLAWAKAYHGEPEPFPRRLKPRSAPDRFRMLSSAALGAHGVNPFGPEVYL